VAKRTPNSNFEVRSHVHTSHCMAVLVGLLFSYPVMLHWCRYIARSSTIRFLECTCCRPSSCCSGRERRSSPPPQTWLYKMLIRHIFSVYHIISYFIRHIKMNNITVQQKKYTFQLAGQTGDCFALMSAHKKLSLKEQRKQIVHKTSNKGP